MSDRCIAGAEAVVARGTLAEVLSLRDPYFEPHAGACGGMKDATNAVNRTSAASFHEDKAA